MSTEKKLTGYPSIDKPWLTYYSEEAINASLPECTIYEYLWENNKDNLNDVALVYFGKKITYKELFANIDKTASAFVALGVLKGDIVTIQSLSLPQVVFIIYALSKIGAVANLVYATSTLEELRSNIVETQSAIYITIDSIFDKFDEDINIECLKKTIVLSIDDEMGLLAKTVYRLKAKNNCHKNNGNILRWKEFIDCGIDEKVDLTGESNDAVVMVYTGGTTGKSKGVLLSNYNLNVGALQYWHLGFERQKIFLSVLPPFIAFGITVTMHMLLTFGLKTVLGLAVNPSEISGFIEQYKPNYVICGTVQAEKMMNVLNQKKIDLSFLTCLSVGGDVLTPKLEERLNNFLERHNSKIKVAQGYAMSETAASTAASTYTVENVVYKKGTIGVPFVYTNIKIVDVDTNEELPYGMKGEICINAPCVMMGYYKNEEETRNILKLHSDGKVWVHTGDVGMIDESGFITITGRIKRMILCWENGVCHKVFPKILEDEFLKIECINSISIVGKPEQEENNLVAFVVTEKDVVEQKVLAELEKFAKDNFEKYECPSKYVVLKNLPLTTIGKIDYRKLEKMADEE